MKTTALVRSDVSGVAQKTPMDCEFRVGQKVRLRADLGPMVYMVAYRDHEHRQYAFEDSMILRRLTAGETITSVEVLANPVSNEVSTSEDSCCWFKIGFAKIGGCDNWLRFASWQFEAV